MFISSVSCNVPLCWLIGEKEPFLPPAIRRMTEGYIFSLSTFRGGGVPVSDPGGGPGSQIFLGGGARSQIFQGGSQVSDFRGGPRSQIFLGGYPVSVKGKFFDTRFGLIHVQTGKKFFCRGYASCVHAGGLSCWG